MAATFTGSRQGEPQVFPFGANSYAVISKITCAGTTTDNGDPISADVFGLASLSAVFILSNAVDSESNPENMFVTSVVQPTEGTFKVVFGAQAVADAATPLVVITDGTSVADYVFYAMGVGKY